ncbi:metallophosphoesterase [Rhizobium leguminosarum]|uniref:metallophosphoesterase n=1 Tax=Rhizobium leguminosarum TaxID=384 RepID=UPI00143FA0C0|nr:metallophosphoesterase [Rhizobium leguminosarum]NKL23696.1 phosphohydrolase [Rhizobium leguminosarum bv. viciae]
MRAWIISDLHSTFLDLAFGRKVVVPDADVCVCAGDIADNIERAIDFLHAEIAPYMPVVATLGNHDYYGSSIDYALEYARRWNAGTNVYVLENETFRKGDLRILGATLWTDFSIGIQRLPHNEFEAHRDSVMKQCSAHSRDFHKIYRSDARTGREGGFVTPKELVSRHWDSRSFIENDLAKPFDGTTMVLTHHAILPQSLDGRYAGHISNAAIASDLSSLIHQWRPHFWVHGHTHRFQDYIEGSTRILCNPRGQIGESPRNGFRPGFVVETTVRDAEEGNDE